MGDNFAQGLVKVIHTVSVLSRELRIGRVASAVEILIEHLRHRDHLIQMIPLELDSLLALQGIELRQGDGGLEG